VFKKNIPLSNLKAELRRIGKTNADVARLLERTQACVVNKMNGKYEYSISEALMIQKEFFPYHDLNYLFYQE